MNSNPQPRWPSPLEPHRRAPPHAKGSRARNELLSSCCCCFCCYHSCTRCCLCAGLLGKMDGGRRSSTHANLRKLQQQLQQQIGGPAQQLQRAEHPAAASSSTIHAVSIILLASSRRKQQGMQRQQRRVLQTQVNVAAEPAPAAITHLSVPPCQKPRCARKHPATGTAALIPQNLLILLRRVLSQQHLMHLILECPLHWLPVLLPQTRQHPGCHWLQQTLRKARGFHLPSTGDAVNPAPAFASTGDADNRTARKEQRNQQETSGKV